MVYEAVAQRIPLQHCQVLPPARQLAGCRGSRWHSGPRMRAVDRWEVERELCATGVSPVLPPYRWQFASLVPHWQDASGTHYLHSQVHLLLPCSVLLTSGATGVSPVRKWVPLASRQCSIPIRTALHVSTTHASVQAAFRRQAACLIRHWQDASGTHFYLHKFIHRRCQAGSIDAHSGADLELISDRLYFFPGKVASRTHRTSAAVAVDGADR